MRAWYARRAVPRTALLGCGLLTVAVVTAVHVWTGASAFLLPLALAVTAAASGFVFDDPALPVTAVTPRRRWARTSRFGVAGAPVLTWALLLVALPDDVVLDGPRWWLVGLAACLVAAGTGAIASELGHLRPGAPIASAAALLTVLPMVAGPFFSWEPVFPLGTFPDDVLVMWAGLGALGVVLCVAASRERRRW